MKNKKLIKAIFGISWLVSLVFGTIVYAMPAPDSTPTIPSTTLHVNRNLLEPNDVLIYGDYDIPYASIPTTAADQVFIFRLKDGATELGQVLPFVKVDNGYNLGVFSFYFSGSANLTWGVAYTIEISAAPSANITFSPIDYTIPLSAYTTSTDQTTNQNQLSINIIAAANRMQIAHPLYTFVDSSPGAGTILASPTGEDYFRGAIPGIQAMAPNLYNVQILEIDRTDRTWTTAQFDTYSQRFSTGNYTWVGTAENATATQTGLPKDMAMSMITVLPLCVGAIVLSTMKFHRAEPGFVACFVFFILGALMGWMPMAVFASFYQIAGIYLAYVVCHPLS